MPLSSAGVVCIVGPTASGKTDLAQQLAAALGGEVVSADSMQVYRGMDIGTGKLPACERIVAHHLIDVVRPDEPYSAALFQRDARAAFRDIASRGAQPVLAGGTGFYVRAAIDDFAFPAGEQVGTPSATSSHASWRSMARKRSGTGSKQPMRRARASCTRTTPNG